MIVHRKDLRQTIADILAMLQNQTRPLPAVAA